MESEWCTEHARAALWGFRSSDCSWYMIFTLQGLTTIDFLSLIAGSAAIKTISYDERCFVDAHLGLEPLLPLCNRMPWG